MRKRIKQAAAAILCSIIFTGAASVLPQSPVVIEAQAHGGRTDRHGGHKDNKNASGPGNCRYRCGGNSPHLHSGGRCPYSGATDTKPVQAIQENTGWHHDGSHWNYTCTDGTSPSGCWKQIDSVWYCFDESGSMRTGWYEEGESRYYLGSDGKMATGTAVIDGSEYRFDENGKLQ